MKKIGIIGGGAAGYFLAANLPKNKNYQVTILEQSIEPLQKVKISGGGRCNVTNASFNINELVENYPRGKKELLSVFNYFQPKDTIEWFAKNDVLLKVEIDNRVFPVSNQSSSIINCLRKKVINNNVIEKFSSSIQTITKKNNLFKVSTREETFDFDLLVVATGSSPKSWQILKLLSHTIIEPLPSLFTFNCKDELLNDMAGTSFNNISVKIDSTKLIQNGPAIITHWGLSGPAILKLSAWGARVLAGMNYKFNITINWVNSSNQEVLDKLFVLKKANANKSIINLYSEFPVTKNFWIKLLKKSKIDEQMKLSEVSKINLYKLTEVLTQTILEVSGKSTFKEEFVTCGGIDLKEINFKSMESKIVPNLFLAGEVLNIDAVTGGFNFQAAWSQGYIISEHIKSQLF